MISANRVVPRFQRRSGVFALAPTLAPQIGRRGRRARWSRPPPSRRKPPPRQQEERYAVLPRTDRAFARPAAPMSNPRPPNSGTGVGAKTKIVSPERDEVRHDRSRSPRRGELTFRRVFSFMSTPIPPVRTTGQHRPPLRRRPCAEKGGAARADDHHRGWRASSHGHRHARAVPVAGWAALSRARD